MCVCVCGVCDICVKAAKKEKSGTKIVAIPSERMKGIGTSKSVARASAIVNAESLTVRPALAITLTIAEFLSRGVARTSRLKRVIIKSE